jgi:glycosyltransferase involved in cell wall biosynthesis
MVSGAAIVAQRLAEAMAERGHSILVLAASDTGRPYTVTCGNLRIVKLSSFPNPLRVGQRFVPQSGRRVLDELASFRPELVHSHDPLSIGLAGLLAARRLRIPAALTLHQLPWFVSQHLPAIPLLRRLVEAGLWVGARWLAGRCQALITPSRTVADIVRRQGICCPEAISNGIDLARFTAAPAEPHEDARLRRRYGLDAARPVILYVGRIDADKQVAAVVRAAARAMRSVAAQLLIVGDGTQRAAVTRLAEQLSIRGQCHFPGFVAASGDLPGLYRLASVFVTASEIETQGLVLLEAMAAGLPIVAVAAGAVPELVRHGVNGWLVPPQAEAAFAERLTAVLANREQARAFGQAGRALAQAHAFDDALEAHERVYRTLAAMPLEEVRCVAGVKLARMEGT